MGNLYIRRKGDFFVYALEAKDTDRSLYLHRGIAAQEVGLDGKTVHCIQGLIRNNFNVEIKKGPVETGCNSSGDGN